MTDMEENAAERRSSRGSSRCKARRMLTPLLAPGICILLTGLLALVVCRTLRTPKAMMSEKADSGYPNLFWAGIMGDVAVAERLIKEGADVNAIGPHGYSTPLCAAALRHDGSTGVTKLLIAAGADVNKECPLYYAAAKGNVEIMRLLLDAGADPNLCRMQAIPTPVLAAARDGHLDAVEFLVKHGSELGDGDEKSALMEAAVAGHADVVKFLAEQGANLDLRNSVGDTALHRAAWRSRVETVRVLLKAGADPSIANNDGVTPLQTARRRGHAEIVSLLATAHEQE